MVHVAGGAATCLAGGAGLAGRGLNGHEATSFSVRIRAAAPTTASVMNW